MKKLFYISMLLMLIAGIVLPCVDIEAAKQPENLYTSSAGIKHVVSSNTDITYTGNSWTDSDGNTKYEYVARISQAPIYNIDGTPVDCSWHGSEDAYVIVNNVFSAQVIGSYIVTMYQGQTMSWNPIVLVDSKEYAAKGNPVLLTVDPVNPNYQNNVLEWDYEVCVRRVRVIEGMIQETWIFDKNPKGTVWINSNTQQSAGFVWAIAPYAYDANDNALIINEYKQVMASEFDRAVYPVTIDPTETYYTSASDGMIMSASTPWATSWAQDPGSNVYDVLTWFQIGSRDNGGGNWYIGRVGLFFDTSAIPDSATISAANLSLYGKTDGSVADFNISITNGQPTYPHDPLVVGDYGKAYYSGIGNAGFNTSGFSTAGYNNISLNSTGMGWISLTGTTKFMVRSFKDINGTAPTSNEYVYAYSYEQGAGFRPYLEVTYAGSGVPTVTTNPVTYVTKTSARLNGYVNADGGEADTVSFNYQPWYNSAWNDCIEFTINASYVDADLTNFPVLVTGSQLNTTDPDFWTSTRANGSDILFTASDGVTKLNRELVSFCTSTYSMECYVNVTTVDDTADTKFYMYYNNSAGLENNSTATWDTDFHLVYHMNDNPNTSTIQDSTAGNRDGTKIGANEPLETTGAFNGDKAQFFDGVNDRINFVGNITNVTNQTAELYLTVNSTSVANNRYITSYGYLHHYIAINQSTITMRGDNAGAMTKTLITFSANNWFIYAGTYSQNGTYSWFDGMANGSPLSTTQYTKLPTTLSGTYIDNGTYNGTMTEYRLSNVTRSDAWLDATYHTLMTPTNFAPVTDVFNTTSTQSKNTGDSFYISQTGLVASSLYGYKAEAVNSYGTAWGHWLFFNISVTLGAPSNGLCNPTSSSIELTWSKGGNSSHTYIRWKTGSYPTGTADGNLLCNTSDVGYTHSGLTSGTTYYYRLWGEDGGTYSTTNTTIMCTTLAGAGVTSTPVAPSEPDTWTSGTNSSTIENLPIYDIGNSFWDTFSFPHNTGWMIASLSLVMVSGFIIYSRSKNLLVAILTVMIFSIVLSIIGMMPMWFVYAFAITSLGMSWKELR